MKNKEDILKEINKMINFYERQLNALFDNNKAKRSLKMTRYYQGMLRAYSNADMIINNEKSMKLRQEDITYLSGLGHGYSDIVTLVNSYLYSGGE
jgi:hypothetical protein